MKMPPLKNIIRYHRKKAGLSQKGLADLADLGKTVVYDIEQGKMTIRLDTLLKILSVLNVSIEFSSPFMTEIIEEMNEKG